jgi:hypothetical protein
MKRERESSEANFSGLSFGSIRAADLVQQTVAAAKPRVKVIPIRSSMLARLAAEG